MGTVETTRAMIQEKLAQAAEELALSSAGEAIVAELREAADLVGLPVRFTLTVRPNSDEVGVRLALQTRDGE